jgi:hypothetical protein
VTCLASINETRVILIAGTIGIQTNSAKTFYFDALTNLWSNGPSLATGRLGHGCGRIEVSSTSPAQTVIVAGGQAALRSVEILDGGTNTWHAGTIT